MFLLKRLEFVFLGDLGICLKRKRDIRIKTIIPSQNTALLLTPALIINKKRKLARLITQYRDILSNTSQGTAFLLQGVAEDDSSLRYVYFDKLPCWRHSFSYSHSRLSFQNFLSAFPTVLHLLVRPSEVSDIHPIKINNIEL